MSLKNTKKTPRTVLVADHERRFIWLDSEAVFTAALAEGVIKILQRLDRESNGRIKFYIRGVGGDFFAFVKVAHVIESLKSSVDFVAFDFVRSGCFWVTQCGESCSAVKGTKMVFHRAIHPPSAARGSMSQKDYLNALDQLKLVDAIQFWIFSWRGSPSSTIWKLFGREASLSVGKAIKLNLVSGLYSKTDFNKDRKIAEKLARDKYKF